jgi:hypothetical protein
VYRLNSFVRQVRHRAHHDRQRTKPVAVELSYRYGDPRERYGGVAARRAFDVFQVIRTTLRPWVDPNAMTKTALVYN